MRSVWEKIWLRLLIVVLILGLTAVGLVVRYIKFHFEDDDSYTITVTKTHVDGGAGQKMIMVYDKEGKLLMYQSDSRLQGFTYDEQGNMLSHKLYYLDGTLLEETYYTYNDQGQLILARESGPELVGTMGGRTAVANNSEITEGIRQGVYEAVSAAMGNGNQEVSVRVYLDSREIKSGQNRLNRAMGVV